MRLHHVPSNNSKYTNQRHVSQAGANTVILSFLKSSNLRKATNQCFLSKSKGRILDGLRISCKYLQRARVCFPLKNINHIN